MINFCIIIYVNGNIENFNNLLNSIISQSYKNYKIYVINDNLIDFSSTYENICIKNEKIKILKNNENIGKYRSINIILNQLNSDAFLILDENNILQHDRLESDYKVLNENNNIIMVQSLKKFIDAETKKIITGNNYYFSSETYRIEIIKKIGLFNENRFGGDIEYYYRFKKFFGKDKLKLINKILTVTLYQKDDYFSKKMIDIFLKNIKKLHDNNSVDYFFKNINYQNEECCNNLCSKKNYSLELDINFYRKSYLDIRNMNNDDIIKHWKEIGSKEERLPNVKLFKCAYPNFDFNTYENINPFNIIFTSNYEIYGWIYLNDNENYFEWLKSNEYIDHKVLASKNNINDKYILLDYINLHQIKYLYISSKIYSDKLFLKLSKMFNLKKYNPLTDSYEKILFYGMYNYDDYNILCSNNSSDKYLLWSNNYNSFKDIEFYDYIFTRLLKYKNINHLIYYSKIQKIFEDIKKKITIIDCNIEKNLHIDNTVSNNVIINKNKIENNEINIKLHNNNKYFEMMLFNFDIIEKDSIIINKYITSMTDDKNYFVNSIKFFSKKNLLIELYEKNKIKKNISKKHILKNENKIISIIMSHRNRPDLLFLTLLELNKSKNNNFEVVIVDDRSDQNLKPDFIKNINFNYPIKLISIDNKNNEDIKCSSEVYNIAFENCIGDIIIIQNPECLHFGDLPNYIFNNFKYDDYICFPCFSSNNLDINDYILKNKENINMSNIEDLIGKNNKDKDLGNFINWYQHKQKNDRCLHFCTVISRNFFRMLKGFDPIYKDGFCFEDDDLIYRIKNILKLNVISLETNLNCGVVHMYHGRNKFVNITSYNGEDVEKLAIKEKHELNQNIFNYLKNNDNKISCPKIFHYYWDDFKKFSFMNLYSLRTSLHYHPEYIHVIWTPINCCDKINWKEDLNNSFNIDDNYKKYVEELKDKKNLLIIKFDVNKLLGVDSNMSEVHKSDILRYILLNKFGGIWSDLDIVYIKKITDKINFNFDNLFFKCINDNTIFYPIGLLLCKRNTSFINNLLENINTFYCKDRYQCLGSEMLKKIFDSTNYKDVYFLNNEFYMNYLWFEIDELFIDYKKTKDITNTIGFHWFNGSNITKKYLLNIKNEIIKSNYNGIIFIEKNKFLKVKKNIRLFNQINSSKCFRERSIYIKKILEQGNYEIAYEIINYDIHYSCDKIDDFLKNRNNLMVFDESIYSFLIINYVKNPKLRNIIKEFILNNKYIVFFSELFENNNLKTIGNYYYNTEFSILFFLNSQCNILCNTANINYLLKKNIFNNVLYYPPYGYSEINNICELKKNKNVKSINDIAIFGNIANTNDYEYRKNMIEKIKNYCLKKKNNIIFNNNLYGDEKDNLLANTKIVLHIPSHKNLYTFPWFKVIELMSKKIFFIIEENEELYIRNLNNIVCFYLRNNDNDLYNKIDYYLKNENERNKYIEKCFLYVKEKYNFDKDLIDIIEKYS
jgi:hypothetical protein